MGSSSSKDIGKLSLKLLLLVTIYEQAQRFELWMDTYVLRVLCQGSAGSPFASFNGLDSRQVLLSCRKAYHYRVVGCGMTSCSNFNYLISFQPKENLYNCWISHTSSLCGPIYTDYYRPVRSAIDPQLPFQHPWYAKIRFLFFTIHPRRGCTSSLPASPSLSQEEDRSSFGFGILAR